MGDRLPDPDIWIDEPPVLSDEQQARQAEVDAYLAEQYKEHKILGTTQGYSGDIYDWVDSSLLSAVELPALPWKPEDLVLPEGIQLPMSELDKFPELWGPEGATPLLRPDFSAYVMGGTGASSLQDYLEHHQVLGMPADQDRLYAGLDLVEPNNGISAVVNHYAGEVEENTFSLVELSVACPAVGEVQELIGILISIDRVNFDRDLKAGEAAKPRIHVEYARQVNGELRGVYDLRAPGFKPNRIDPLTWDKNLPFPKRTVLGGEVDVSEPNGVQYEHRFDLFQGPNGDWWVGYNWELLGHYPASLFAMLNKGACRAHWYSEVYDGTPQDWTNTDMGSGLWPSAGANQVAYIRRPAYRAPVWTEWEVTPDLGTPSTPNIPACYVRTKLEVGGPFIGNYFFYTGPGGDGEGCD